MSNNLIYGGVTEMIKGVDIDQQTRCTHFNKDSDIIAIKFQCCNTYYSCFDCHEELSDHVPMIWPKKFFDRKAVLCGNCQTELTINSYLSSNFVCPSCDHKFNPSCKYHYHLYFEAMD